MDMKADYLRDARRVKRVRRWLDRTIQWPHEWMGFRSSAIWISERWTAGLMN
ncbi:MAG: hypothetical protein IPK83_09730 [Planctomycetes bacterium]|nr:hypothetical protein [Planctomycetota bacterium]